MARGKVRRNHHGGTVWITSVVWAYAMGCTPSHCPRAEGHREGRVGAHPPSGLYWGRWEDVPDGVRVAVWLDSDGRRLRGSWDLPPWHGDMVGTVQGRGWMTTWHEEGTVAVSQTRTRTVVLEEMGPQGTLRGVLSGAEDGGTGTVMLTPAGFAPPTLRPGVWMGRWTGLPAGMAVETLLSRDPDGRWRAAYRYQDREGAFVGDPQPNGDLAIQWREISAHNAVAVGAGLLHPTSSGVRGTYGVGERLDGTGDWSLEPVAEE